jgi:hypothetical protein
MDDKKSSDLLKLATKGFKASKEAVKNGKKLKLDIDNAKKGKK